MLGIRSLLYIASGVLAYFSSKVMSVGGVGVRDNVWGNPLKYLIVMLITWHFLWVLGTYIAKIGVISKFLAIFAKSTLWIMCLHMLFLAGFDKLVNKILGPESSFFGRGQLKVLFSMIAPMLLYHGFQFGKGLLKRALDKRHISIAAHL